MLCTLPYTILVIVKIFKQWSHRLYVVISMRGLIREVAKILYGKTDVPSISKARHLVQTYNIYVAKKLLMEHGIEESIRGKTKGYWQALLKYLLPVEWAVWRSYVAQGKVPASEDEFYTAVMAEFDKNELFRKFKTKLEEAINKIKEEVGVA